MEEVKKVNIIDIDSKAFYTRIIIDGKEISNITSFAIEQKAGDFITINLVINGKESDYNIDKIK